MRKKRKQINHAKKRFRERFGIIISDGELYRMAKQIQRGEALFVHKSSNRISIFVVTFKDKKYTVAYDRTRKTVVTVLPENNKELEMENMTQII